MPFHIITRGYHPSAMSIREAAFRGKTYQYARTGSMYIYEGPIFITMDALCTTAASYSTIMTCIWYVLRNTVCTRVLRGGALSKYHTWNDITATPTRRTRLAQRDKQCFDGCVPAPLYPYTYHEAPLIRCEWRDRADRLPALNKDITPPLS